MQTCMDLMEAGYSVHICVDAVSSRSPVDRKVALYRMQQSGIHLTTSESVAFQMKSLSFAILENLNQLAHYPLLAYSSCVWTSSVVIDYLIINTPMIFPFSPNKQIQTKRL